MSACARSEGARPSQKKLAFHARLKSGIALRGAGLPAHAEAEAARIGEGPSSRRWQEAHESVPSRESSGLVKEPLARGRRARRERIVPRQSGQREGAVES